MQRSDYHGGPFRFEVAMRVLFAVLMLGIAGAASAEDLAIDRAWVRLAPPGAQAMAGFMAVTGGSRDVAIESASSADFARVEIHEMEMVDGVMKMRAIESLEVPAGARVTLAPGGEHLMLFEPRRELAAGDTVRIVFELSRGDPLEVDFAVGQGAPEAHDHH
jgi:copper(I)-binding protein